MPQAEPAPLVEAPRAAPGTQVYHDPALVAGLVADHHKLVALFGEIGAAMEKRDARLLRQKLGDFGDALRNHLLTENIKFYVYLQHSLAAESGHAATMREFRREMQHIGKAVADFLQKYTAEAAWDERVWMDFSDAADEIGKVLTRRIQTEENVLYPLYLPPTGSAD